MRPFSRRSAPVEIASSQSKVPLEALSPPGAGSGVDVYRLRLGDHMFACGLLWAPETKSAGRAVVAAREVAREARTKRKAHERERGRRSRERPVGLGDEEDLTGTAQEVAAGAANDLVVVRPIAAELMRPEDPAGVSPLTGAILGGARDEGVEQYAFGSSTRGHEPDDLSLAALVAERAGLSNAVFLLRVNGTDAPVYYYLVVHGGLIRTGSDRCFTDLKEAQLHLHQFVMMLRDTIRAEKSFRFIFSPDIDFGLVDCERRSIEEFLEGPVPFVLRPLLFRLSRRQQRRLVLGAAATVAMGGVGWYALEWLADEDVRRRLARQAEETARRARAARKRLVIDPVREAPWERAVVHRASRFVREAVSAALGVPTFARGGAGAPGAYDLESVRVAVGRVSARYLVLTQAPEVDGAAPQWPVRVERQWDWTPSSDRAVEFSPVALQSVLDGLGEGSAVGTALRNALIRELGGIDRITHEVFRVLVHPGHTDMGKAKSAGAVAWVAQYFEVRVRSRPDGSASLLRALDAARGLQITEVGYLDDDRERWIVRGYVGGALDVLGETRKLQGEMGGEWIAEG